MSRKRSSTFGELNCLKKSKILFNSTNVTPPVTPEKNRIINFDIKPDEDKSAVKKLFTTPPPTPTKRKSDVYSQVKAIFSRGHKHRIDDSRCLVGREHEGSYINNFIKSSISDNTCNCLYIAGPPGCGKTAQLELSLGQMSNKHGQIHLNSHTCKVVNINCMVLMNPKDIFSQICRELGEQRDLHEALAGGIKSYSSVMVILDEIDYLLTRDQEVLFKLFKLSDPHFSSRFSTKLVMIGISNSLDLTTNLLSKLERNQLNPKSVSFKPYTFEKMRSIVTEKLKQLVELEKENLDESFVPIVNSSAILLCCKKVSSSTGDLRRCFDVLYKSIELLEQELKAKMDDTSRYGLVDAPKVSISHIAKVCNLSYGNSILSKLNYLQQIIIIYLFRFEGEEDSSMTINAFYDYYKNKEFGTKKIVKVKRSEFLEILTNLESISLLTLTPNKSIGMRQIQTNVDYSDFKKSIAQVDYLKNLLH
ncbi:AAA ATPase [Yamadazyma tenuis]|uniref:Cell division control protein n=1 Tax=Candida tenuis (strain ATCC 10573 / BCRC 21748 / CBS 615 / JCM 9827 / NBRC 10315 / NRRL Y-1498 / VKM Y-70) TaxID=590646 RepID=G3BEG4_CANTC|nr:cell division control protein Cdc6 [Yamadazyma tenuis ATCC 10573]EGV60539.1 cell division control protein Cdc6 [Yamadazyma tenuis ATCC 10573]WEJ94220.1 AAA ATPase [Yamadazyma tenuis]